MSHVKAGSITVAHSCPEAHCALHANVLPYSWEVEDCCTMIPRPESPPDTRRLAVIVLVEQKAGAPTPGPESTLTGEEASGLAALLNDLLHTKYELAHTINALHAALPGARIELQGGNHGH